MRERGVPPRAIAEAPELQPGLEVFYDAFWTLDSCRLSTGFGGGRIPWTAVDRYCTRHEFEGDQRVDMEDHIQSLDIAFLTYQEKKRKAKTGK